MALLSAISVAAPKPHLGFTVNTLTSKISPLFAGMGGALILAGILFAGADVTGVIAASLLGGGGSDVAIETLFTLVVYGTMLLVAAVGAGVCRTTPVIGTRAGTSLVAGCCIGLCAFLLTLGYAWLAAAVNAGTGKQSFQPLTFLVGLGVVLLQVTAEEAYFRGWLQPLIARACGNLGAIVITAALFALVHVMGGARSALTLCNLVLGGIWFGILAVRAKGIALPVGAHFAWNTAEQMLFGLDPNPGTGSFGTLIDLDLFGSALWGGSHEGLNASLAMSIALIVFIVPFLPGLQRRSDHSGAR